MKLSFTSATICLTLLTQAVAAQNAPLSLRGNILSDNHQAVSGAAVTVIHLPSGTRYAASSNAAGYFVVPNLQAGGPYLMNVGEEGYRPQTVESIFLEKGKAATLTVTLNRLSGNNKGRNARLDTPTPTLTASTESLAPESKVGGPIYLTTNTGAATHSTAAAAPAPAASPAAAPTATAAGPVATRPAAKSAYRRAPYKPHNVKVDDPIVPGHYDAKTGNYLYHTGALTTIKLPNGAVINGVGVNSTESFLNQFLANPASKVDTVDLTKGWYNFDRVFFMTGKATLTPESVDQLRNLATLLKAYPNARVKLGGYTDSTGAYKMNRQLSEARARTAWASLVEMGVNPNRVEARGYGPRYSIAPNTTEEGRAMNRRLSVRVLQK